MGNPALAAALVALAALIWGADSVVTMPGLAGASPTALRLCEHLVGLAVLLPFVLRPSRRELRLFRPRHLLPLFWTGIAGEAVAGLLFGDAYRRLGPGAAGFIQMLQPFCVLGIVLALRKERGSGALLPWATSVFLGALVIWVFDSAFDPSALERADFWGAAGLALAAVGLWAASNVASKTLLKTFAPSSLVFLRWSVSLPGLAVILAFDQAPVDLRPLLRPSSFLVLLFHSVVFALAPLWIFCRGLRELPASVATFVELLCPLTIVFLPWILGGKAIHEAQWLGGISVIVGIALLLRLELEFLRGKAG